MAYQALYRQYRPQVFDDVVEQKHVVKTLKNTVISKKAAHAYLFCGTRGTGKTTMAKIFARAINCLNPVDGNPCNRCEVCEGIINGTILDVIEIDAASNNSVDNVRSIIDEVVYTPTKASKKVYIIDEVHMLSTGAFNALLKTLEEPPEHVVFILATTEPHKLPATVLSRCQRFDFRRITVGGIAERLNRIAGETGVKVTGEALQFIASLSEGALRDGISILDQCISTGKEPIDVSLVREVVGIASGKLVLDTVVALNERNIKESILNIDRLFSQGKDPGHFLQKVIQLYRDILVFKSLGSTENLLSMTDDAREAIPALSKSVPDEMILAAIRELSDLEAGIKWSTSPRILLETAFIRICTREISRCDDDLDVKIKLLESRIRELEEKLSQSGETTFRHEKDKTENNSEYNKDSIENSSKNNEEAMAESRNNDLVRTLRKSGDDGARESRDKRAESEKFSEWNSVLNELKNKGRMAIVANLTETKARWAENETIEIVVPEEDSYKKRMLSKGENLEIITEVIEDITGKPLKVKVVTESAGKPESEENEDIPERIIKFAKQKGIKFDVIE
ncbi:MAG: DNA polymerase III subunit gamma/tau [Clostridiaceae bacterium]|jgi:DNA polymerase-3 subunit gamma/tau|nr:DNA polymerase III subunit gamma/tau [Clostridiaceae bacterium]